jgi:hypothetical protein
MAKLLVLPVCTLVIFIIIIIVVVVVIALQILDLSSLLSSKIVFVPV